MPQTQREPRKPRPLPAGATETMARMASLREMAIADAAARAAKAAPKRQPPPVIETPKPPEGVARALGRLATRKQAVQAEEGRLAAERAQKQPAKSRGTSLARRRQIERRIAALRPEEIERYLQQACEAHLEPGLPLASFEAFVDKCPPAAIQVLRDRLTERGSTAGLARLQAIIDKDPNRK